MLNNSSKMASIFRLFLAVAMCQERQHPAPPSPPAVCLSRNLIHHLHRDSRQPRAQSRPWLAAARSINDIPTGPTLSVHLRLTFQQPFSVARVS